MQLTTNLTICDRIEAFLLESKKGVATLKEIYSVIKEKPNETVRAAIYKDSKDRFKKVAKGVYMLKGENTASLLIEGDGRNLREIEDNSIDFIATDHPWSDSKAHKSGNQKNFADYDTFRYTLEDFKQKARVLKDGAYLAEFLPVESFTNYEYLYEIKQMAKEAGLNYYAKITWRKAPEGAINTGRTTKGVEDICVFYKGKKPRRLSESKSKPYYTTKMLNYTVDIPANKGKEKNHQAEKPVAVYDYLINMFTDVYDVCLDQFGGALNLLESAVKNSRFGIAYEISSEFVKKAVDRFGCITLFKNDETAEYFDEAKEDIFLAKSNKVFDEHKEVEVVEIETIDEDVTKFQLKFLNNIKDKRAEMLTNEEIEIIEKANEDSFSLVSIVNELFKKITAKGYENYVVPQFNPTLEEYSYIQEVKLSVENIFDEKFENKYLKPYYNNYKIEAMAFAEYCVCIEKIFKIETIKSHLEKLLLKYVEYIAKNYPSMNYKRSYTLLNNFFVV
jgi:site-specific DNA-methyltransferase (adenine-specific)